VVRRPCKGTGFPPGRQILSLEVDRMATAQNSLLSPDSPAHRLNTLFDELLADSAPGIRALGALPLKTVAETFHRHPSTIRLETKRGNLSAVVFGGNLFYTREAILAWIATWENRGRRGRRPRNISGPHAANYKPGIGPGKRVSTSV